MDRQDRSTAVDAGRWLEACIGDAERWLFPTILALAAVVRVARWNAVAVLFNDGPAFLEVAEAFRRGEVADALSHPYHPGYSLLTALLSPLFGSSETAGVAVSVLGGVLAVASLFWLMRRAFGVAPALVAAGLLAVNPAAIEYSGDVQSDGLYLGFFLLSAALLFAALEDARVVRAGVAGIVAGLAYLVRPEALGLAVVVALRLGVLWLRGRWPFARAFVFGLCFLLGATAVAAPYLVFLRMESGDWAVSQKKSVGAMVGAEAVPDQGPALQMEAPRSELAAAPPAPEAPPPVRKERAKATGQPLLVALGDVLRTHFRALRYEVLAFLLVAALLVRRPVNRGDVFIATIIGVYGAVLFALAYRYGYVSGRHALPSMVLTMGWAAAGLLAFGPWAARGRRGVALGVLLLFLGILSTIGLGKALRPDRLDSLAERQAAEWLRDQPIEVGGVAARKRRTAYYARAPHIRIPTAARESELASRGATHLIVSSEDLAKYPRLSRQLPAAREPLHRVEAGGDEARVYAIGVP